MEDAPHLFNQRRDIWEAGIILLQMIAGVDVMSTYATPYIALEHLSTGLPRSPCHLLWLMFFEVLSESLRRVMFMMFDQSKKVHPTCADLIGRFKDAAKDLLSSHSDTSSNNGISLHNGWHVFPSLQGAHTESRTQGPLVLNRLSAIIISPSYGRLLQRCDPQPPWTTLGV